MIRAKHVVKRFGPVQALSGVSLEVGRGECVVLAGPPRGGRTTVLRIFATLIRADSGTIEIDGDAVAARLERVRRCTIYCDGWLAAADRVTTTEYIAFVVGARSGGARAAAPAAAIAQRAGLDGAARVDRLDADGRARLALACALASSADVLLIDEALRDVSDAARPRFAEWVDDRCREGATVVAACGDESATSLPATRVIVFDSGRAAPALGGTGRVAAHAARMAR